MPEEDWNITVEPPTGISSTLKLVPENRVSCITFHNIGGHTQRRMSLEVLGGSSEGWQKSTVLLSRQRHLLTMLPV